MLDLKEVSHVLTHPTKKTTDDSTDDSIASINLTSESLETSLPNTPPTHQQPTLSQSELEQQLKRSLVMMIFH